MGARRAVKKKARPSSSFKSIKKPSSRSKKITRSRRARK